MKKALSILLALMLLLTLCACGNDDPSTEPETNPSTESTTPSTEAPTECTHSYTEAVTKEATCAEEGVKTFTCSKCGDSYTEAIEKIAHSYTEAITKEATCKEEGVKTYTCSGCGDSYTESIAKVDHSWKNATCTAPKTCTSCGATEGSAAGHKWKNATCTAPKTCTTCGATEGEKAAHSYTDGICSNCGNVDLASYIVGKWRYLKKVDDGYYDITTFRFSSDGTFKCYRGDYDRFENIQYREDGIWCSYGVYAEIKVGDTEITEYELMIDNEYYGQVMGSYSGFEGNYTIEGDLIKISCYEDAPGGPYDRGTVVCKITNDKQLTVVENNLNKDAFWLHDVDHIYAKG